MVEIATVLIIIAVWACHRGLMTLVDYLLEKVVMIGFGVGILYSMGRMLV